MYLWFLNINKLGKSWPEDFNQLYAIDAYKCQYVKPQQALISVTDALERYFSRGLLAKSFVYGLWLEWGLR